LKPIHPSDLKPAVVGGLAAFRRVEEIVLVFRFGSSTQSKERKDQVPLHGERPAVIEPSFSGFGGQGWLGAPTPCWPARIPLSARIGDTSCMLAELGPQRRRKVDWVAHSVSLTHAPDLFF